MQFAPAKQSLGIVFDSDMGNDAGAALALALLNALEGKNECRIISLTTSKTNLKSAAFLDATVRFYGSAITGTFAEILKNKPIGMSELGFSKEDTPLLTAALSHPETETVIRKFNDTAEPHALIRNMLTAQQDGNAAVVLAGPATNLARTMELQNTLPVIEKKVRYLVVQSGALRGDLPTARKLLTQWPTPIYAAGPEVGTALSYPAESLEKDFAWAKAHPIADGVRAAKPGDVPAAAMAAVLYAVRPKENFFKLSEPGNLSIADNGAVKFTANPDGKHFQILVDETQREHVIKTYTELASAKPMPRTFSRGKQADAIAKDPANDKAKQDEDLKKPETEKVQQPPAQQPE